MSQYTKICHEDPVYSEYLQKPAAIEKLKEELITKLVEQRNEILEAFYAKYGESDPAKIEQVLCNGENGELIYFVRKRE